MGQNPLSYSTNGVTDNRVNTIGREGVTPLGQVPDRSAGDRLAGDFPNISGNATGSDPISFGLPQGIQLGGADTQVSSMQTGSPFQCSNSELIKRMVDRESVRFTE